jgi:Trk K+ transport system NAD-binding subunit
VLLLADVRVTSAGQLAGQLVKSVHQAGEVRVIALRRPSSSGVDWSPWPDYRLLPQDCIYVLATRQGLSRVLSRNSAR